MKALILFTLVLLGACNAATEGEKATTSSAQVSTTTDKAAAALKEEDCDDKAKKPIEIKEETISLSGNTGCSLDEASLQK